MNSRQRLANRLLLVVNLVTANAAAAAFVVMFLQPSWLGIDLGLPAANLPERVVVLPLERPLAWSLPAAGCLLLLWNFAWLVRRREAPAPSNWVVSDTPSGPVRVAREALETSMRQAGEALPEITRLRVQLDTRTQKRLLITAQFQCAEGTNNLAASQRLRTAMLDRLGEMVRPTDGARAEVEIEFQGFAGRLGKKSGEVPPPEPAPFTGPKYPIDDDPGVGDQA